MEDNKKAPVTIEETRAEFENAEQKIKELREKIAHVDKMNTIAIIIGNLALVINMITIIIRLVT